MTRDYPGDACISPHSAPVPGLRSWSRQALAGLCLWLAVTAPLSSPQAQPVRKPIRVLTTKEGLPQSFVAGMVQDAAGFVWVGTRNGLARYDGRQFVAVHDDQSDSTSRSAEVIIRLLPDWQKTIWIEYESGELDRFSPRSQRLERISQRPLFARHPRQFARRGWTVDTHGTLWGTQLRGGLWAYDWAAGALRHYTRRGHGLPSDTIRGLLASRRGALWLLSPDALSRFDPATGKSAGVRLPQPIQGDSLPVGAGGTVPLFERRNGELMWTYGGQLLIFSPATGQFRRHRFPSPNQTWVQTAPDGQEYLVTLNRLYRYDPVRGPVLVGELPPGNAESILVDQSGLVWVGTNAGGIHQLDLKGPYFERFANQRGFHPDVFEQQWGLSLSRAFDWPATQAGFRQLSYLVRTTDDPRKRLWVGLRYRAGYVDSTQRRLVLLPPLPAAHPTHDRRLGLSGLRFDPGGLLWAVDNDGNVAFCDVQRRAWTRWLAADQLRQEVAPRIVPQDLVADKEAIWITDHQHGLIRLERATKRIRVIHQATPGAHFLTNMLLGMQPDPSRANVLWIGSYAGLIRLDKTTLRGRTFTTAQGLPDNTIYSILADRRGYLWLSTNKGLCRFDPRTHQVRSFNTTDGLPGDEFNRFHHLALPDGRLAFGGTEGWVLFDPLSIQDDTFQPPLALTELKINNRPVPLTPGRGPLPVPLNELGELTVPFAQNTLSVSFAGLEYQQPARLRYRYQLVGYDENWVDAGLTPLAAYTQLPPGRYTLRVSATNTTGQWSRHEHTLGIRVRPPWWRTGWAYGAYLLLGLSLLRVYIRLRTQQAGERQQRLAQQREATQLRHLDELKTRFFANVTHELRTPLSLLLGPAQHLQTRLQDPEDQRWLAMIDRQAHQLLALTNQLLDLSRLEAGVVRVNEQPGDLTAFVARVVDSLRPEVDRKGLTLTLTNNLPASRYWFDAEKLERILLNLLTNALKFTPQGGIQVWLRDGVELIVADSGPGLSPTEQERVFDRYYQATPTSASAPGSGIGLALVSELVTLQGGTVRVESPWTTAHSGTRFVVTLPYRLVWADEPAVPPDNPPVDHSPDEPETPVAPQERSLVLVVEDNADLRAFISQTIAPFGRVLTADDGLAGWERALAAGPDLIISDVLMPRLDGYTLCQRLKEDPRTSHMPVVLLTAKTTVDDRMQGLAGGADAYLTKPIHPGELQLRVRNLLATQRRLVEKIRADRQTPAAPDETIHPFLTTLYQMLEQHLDNAAFGAEELAAEAGMSRMQLYRKLKALTGLAATDFIRSYRLKRAVGLLQQGQTVAQTAYAVGFESPSYFGQCFREQFGEPPSRFAGKASQ